MMKTYYHGGQTGNKRYDRYVEGRRTESVERQPRAQVGTHKEDSQRHTRREVG
jgi:hypothetical protein